MSPEIVRAIVEHLAEEPGTRRIFLVEEFERVDVRGVACYATSFTTYEDRAFTAEREIEHRIDKLRADEDAQDAEDGMKLIEEVERRSVACGE